MVKPRPSNPVITPFGEMRNVSSRSSREICPFWMRKVMPFATMKPSVDGASVPAMAGVPAVAAGALVIVVVLAEVSAPAISGKATVQAAATNENNRMVFIPSDTRHLHDPALGLIRKVLAGARSRRRATHRRRAERGCPVRESDLSNEHKKSR